MRFATFLVRDIIYFVNVFDKFDQCQNTHELFLWNHNETVEGGLVHPFSRVAGYEPRENENSR